METDALCMYLNQAVISLAEKRKSWQIKIEEGKMTHATS